MESQRERDRERAWRQEALAKCPSTELKVPWANNLISHHPPNPSSCDITTSQPHQKRVGRSHWLWQLKSSLHVSKMWAPWSCTWRTGLRMPLFWAFAVASINFGGKKRCILCRTNPSQDTSYIGHIVRKTHPSEDESYLGRTLCR